MHEMSGVLCLARGFIVRRWRAQEPKKLVCEVKIFLPFSTTPTCPSAMAAPAASRMATRNVKVVLPDFILPKTRVERAERKKNAEKKKKDELLEVENKQSTKHAASTTRIAQFLDTQAEKDSDISEMNPDKKTVNLPSHTIAVSSFTHTRHSPKAKEKRTSIERRSLPRKPKVRLRLSTTTRTIKWPMHHPSCRWTPRKIKSRPSTTWRP